MSPSPNGGAPVVLLRPLMVYVHWCTAFGVCTESALDRLQCCNCGSASKKEDHTSRCVRALSGNPDDDKKINSTSPYVCCSANDILCRYLFVSVLNLFCIFTHWLLVGCLKTIAWSTQMDRRASTYVMFEFGFKRFNQILLRASAGISAAVLFLFFLTTNLGHIPCHLDGIGT